jgi:hypothetical protein
MSAAAELAPFAALGLVGSLHCAGMCGPLALSLGLARGRPARALPQALFYLAGKGLAYALLAVLLALAVSSAAQGAQAGSGAALARSILAWLAGGILVLSALRLLGWNPGLRGAWLAQPRAAFEAALRSIRALPRPAASLGLGLVNGFLPCGLSWSAIALAAAARSWVTPVGPLVFGLATGPVLVALALGGGAIPLTWRARGLRVAGVLLFAFGCLTIARGGLPGGAASGDCCEVLGAGAPPR